jgi:aminoglycoside phosphotransferase (APT) family kinase protein
VPKDVAAAVDRVHERPASLAERLGRHCCTLVHGDLKLANMGFTGDRVVILDWGSLTSWAPAEVDYAWFVAVNGASIDATHDELLADARRAMGAHHDARAMRLALLGALAQLGWDKALGATDPANEAVRRREREGLEWWVARARDAFEVWSEG